MNNPNLIRTTKGLLAVVACVALASCADLASTGSGPSFLIMESVAASRGTGATSSTFTTSLDSDVMTNSSVFTDLGQASVRAEMKNQLSTTAPSAINSVTLTRYRVRYRRTDGKNVEGVDVPFGFDGASTVTIAIGSSGNVVFDLVRLQGKLEAPLRNLIGGGGQIVISTIAEVTLFGRDQAGNDVSVTGSIDVKFADFGDS